MPPAISDDESDTGNAVAPVSAKREKSKPVSYADDADMDEDEEEDEAPAVKSDIKGGQSQPEGDEEGEDDDDDEMGEDEFVVEKILAHAVRDGQIKYKVKWEGYEKKSDQTWEDEENLRENASTLLDGYLESVGGRETILDESNSAQAKKRGRGANANAASNGNKRTKCGDHPASSTPPTSLKSDQFRTPAGSWEDAVESIDACHDEDSGKLMVYLTWKDGHKSQHDTPTIYKRCPQKMLQFYERHVKIVKTSVAE